MSSPIMVVSAARPRPSAWNSAIAVKNDSRTRSSGAISSAMPASCRSPALSWWHQSGSTPVHPKLQETNHDGYMDTHESYGHGHESLEHPHIDFNGDGHNDSYYSYADGYGNENFLHTDGHGHVDAIAQDSNHNGLIDREWVDENHNGTLDHKLTDGNGDGIMDYSTSV